MPDANIFQRSSFSAAEVPVAALPHSVEPPPVLVSATEIGPPRIGHPTSGRPDKTTLTSGLVSRHRTDDPQQYARRENVNVSISDTSSGDSVSTPDTRSGVNGQWTDKHVSDSSVKGDLNPLNSLNSLN